LSSIITEESFGKTSDDLRFYKKFAGYSYKKATKNKKSFLK